MRRRTTWFDVVNIIFLTVLLFLIVIPFYYTVIKSFMGGQEYAFSGGAVLWPKKFIWDNYKDIFATGKIWRGYLNSFFYTVVGVAYSMFLTVTMAYGLSKRKFPLKRLFQNMVIFTMFFSGGLIPFFLAVKSLRLMDTRAAIILPLGFSVFNLIIMRTFFEQLPVDIEEAATIDGASPLRIFIQIHLPLVKPALATLVLFYAVDRWNEWFYSGLFVGKGDLWPIQLVLRQVLMATNAFAKAVPNEAGRQVFSEGIKSASVIITMLPIMCVYPFLQRYFVKGVMIGAIKS